MKYRLSYAVAFLFSAEYKQQFRMGKTFYQYINTVHDSREDGRGTNTLCVVYNNSKQKYEVLLVDENTGNINIEIL